MPCYNPTRVVMDGKHVLDFGQDWKNAHQIDGQTVVNLRCRHCIGCNMARQREWSVRAFHEAQLHTENWQDPKTGIQAEIPNSCVITLTYDDDHLPENGVLEHKDFQRFIRHLRLYRKRKLGISTPVRYLMAGEYGGATGRPHYHAIIFNHTFADQYAGHGDQIYSLELDYLWSKRIQNEYHQTQNGIASVDSFSFAAACYVAGYVAKKSSTNGHQGPIRETVDEAGTHRFLPISPEYTKMSTHPGLGAEWILQPQNLAYVYSEDSIKIGSWTFHPPTYYDKLIKLHRPDLFGDIQANRRTNVKDTSDEWTPQRCADAETIVLAKLQQRRDSL